MSATSAIPKETDLAGTPAAPPVPDALADTGLSPEVRATCCSRCSTCRVDAPAISSPSSCCLPFAFVDDQLLTLQQRRFVEVRGTTGPNRAGYLFDLTGDGRDRAREALASSQYVGPAPVPLAQYRTWIEKQSIRNAHVTRETVREGFSSWC